MVSQGFVLDDMGHDELVELRNSVDYVLNAMQNIPGFTLHKPQKMVQGVDNILELTNVDDAAKCTYLDLYHTRITNFMINKSKFYFSRSFPILQQLNLRNTKNISQIISVIFNETPNIYPSLCEIDVSSSDVNEVDIGTIRTHFARYDSFIREPQLRRLPNNEEEFVEINIITSGLPMFTIPSGVTKNVNLFTRQYKKIIATNIRFTLTS